MRYIRSTLAALVVLTATVPLAACLHTGATPPVVATVQLDTKRAQTIARTAQKVIDDTLARLHASGVLTGAAFNDLKAKAGKAGKLLDTGDDLIAKGNTVLGSADITSALASLADVQAATNQLGAPQ